MVGGGERGGSPIRFGCSISIAEVPLLSERQCLQLQSSQKVRLGINKRYTGMLINRVGSPWAKATTNLWIENS